MAKRFPPLFFVATLLPWTAVAQAPEVADTVARGPGAQASRSMSGSFLSGYYALTQGDTSVARRYLEQVAKEDPQNVEIRSRLLLMQINDGDMAAAVESAEGLKRQDGHELVVELLLAVDAARRERYIQAADVLQAANVPQFNEIWLPLLREWLTHADAVSAKPFTLKSVFPGRKNLPNFLMYHLGLLNDFTGHTDEAARLYSAAVKDFNRAPFRAAQAYIQQRAAADDRKALIVFADRLRKARPDTYALLLGRYPYLAHLDGPQVLPVEPLVTTAKEGMAEVLFTMASLLHAVESTPDVVLYLRMALYLRPDFPTAQLMLGNILETSDRTAQARELYAQILPDNPLYVPARVHEAYLLDSLKRSDEALALLERVAKTAPQAAEVMVARGDILRTQRKYPEAIVQYNEAIARTLTPSAANWGMFFARGTCFERMGDNARAEEDLTQALALAPNQPEVLNYLGYMWLTNGEQKERAFKLIERAYTLTPQEPHIVDSYGWAHYLIGKLPRAVTLLEEAVSSMPDEPTINDHLGDAYWHSDRKTEARFQWQRALDQATDIEQQAVLKTKLKQGLSAYPFGKATAAPAPETPAADLVYE